MAILIFFYTKTAKGDISVPLVVRPQEEQFIKSIIRILAVALNPPHSLWAIYYFLCYAMSAVIIIITVKDGTLYHAFKQDNSASLLQMDFHHEQLANVLFITVSGNDNIFCNICFKVLRV